MLNYGMNKKLLSIISCLILLVTAQNTLANERPDATIVVDAFSGKVLSAVAADSPRFPASLTKMMTLYLLFDELKAGRYTMNSRLKVSSHASKAEPSRLGLKPGQTITVKEAIYALITKSANDVAIVVGENIAGSEAKFAARMTKKARAIGMSRTTFKNASGLPDPSQKTTARDMATLGRMLIINHGNYYHMFGAKSYNIKGVSYKNHNGLLGKYAGIDGIKTGYIRAAGFNLVASAQRGDMRLVGVVIGGETSASRNSMMTKLLDRGFIQLASKRKNWVNPKAKPQNMLRVANSSPTQETPTQQVATNDTQTTTEPDTSVINDLLAGNSTASSKALTIVPPPARPFDTAQASQSTAQSQPNAKTNPSGQYAIILASQSTYEQAEEKAHIVYDSIKNIIPEGHAKIYPLATSDNQFTYEPMIQGLNSTDALTACQLVKNMGESCNISSANQNLATQNQSS